MRRERRLRSAARPGDAAGLDGGEAIFAARIGERAAEPAKPGALLRIAALRIRLPDLQHGIRNRLAVAVEHAAFDRDPLALPCSLGEIGPAGPEALREEGTDRLRRSGGSFRHRLSFHGSRGAAAQDDVESITERVLRFAEPGIVVGDEAAPG